MTFLSCIPARSAISILALVLSVADPGETIASFVHAGAATVPHFYRIRLEP